MRRYDIYYKIAKAENHKNQKNEKTKNFKKKKAVFEQQFSPLGESTLDN